MEKDHPADRTRSKVQLPTQLPLFPPHPPPPTVSMAQQQLRQELQELQARIDTQHHSRGIKLQIFGGLPTDDAHQWINKADTVMLFKNITEITMGD